MDLRAIGRAMRRQFPVVLLIAIVTVYVAMTSAKDTQARYEGKASLLFVSSPQGLDNQGKPITVNPFNLAGTAEQFASSAVLALSRSPGFTDQLRANGATGDVKFRRGADAVLNVTSSAKTPAAALDTLDTSVTLVSNQLAASQASAGAPAGSYMKIETIASTDRAREIKGSPMKSVGAIAVVGIAVAIAAALALDAIAPNGFRSGLRWVVRSGRGVAGRVTLAPSGPGARAPSGPPRPPPIEPDAVPTSPLASTTDAVSASPTGDGNRQTRREAARAANRISRRDPVARRPSDGDGASRPASRST